MKKLIKQSSRYSFAHNLIFGLVILLFLIPRIVNGDELQTATATGESTTVTANVFVDVTTATINITNIGDVENILVIATFEVEAADRNAHDAYFKIHDVTNNTDSQILQRFLERTTDGDKGIGSVVYIFDVSDDNGSLEFKLQHASSSTSYENTTKGTIVAIALSTSTGKIDLNNDIKNTVGQVSAGDNTFADVLTTDAISLPVSGSIFVVSSINNELTTGNTQTGEWKLQQKSGINGSWSDIGNIISRSITNNQDYGIASIGLISTNLARGDYYYRLQCKGPSGTSLVTENTTIVAVALGYDDGSEGRAFPAFSKSKASQTTSSNSFVDAESEDGDPASSTDMFFYAQYNMSASAAIDAPSFDIALSDGGGVLYNSMEQRRTISSGSDVGSGASVGLAKGLNVGTTYTGSLRHKSDGSVTITTSNIILSGFQTADQPAEGYWVGGDSGNETEWNNTANWANGVIPTSTTNITILNGKSHYPEISAAASCNNLIIGEEGEVTVSSNTLSVSGDLVVESGGSIINNSAISITGSVKAKRYVEKDIWHYVSSPVGSQAIDADFIVNNDIKSPNSGTNYNFYRWDEPSNEWIIYGDGSFGDGSFVNGRGYAITTASDRNLEFSGTFNSVNVPVSLNKTDGNGREGSNLVGNPFLAPISLSDFTNEANNPNIEGTVYFWAEQNGWSYPSDNYAYWNGSGSAGSGTQAPDDQIGVAQAFMVQAETHGGNVNFNTDMQTHANPTYFKSTDISRIKLSIQYQDDYYNETLIAMLDDATIGFDRDYDGRKLISDANLYMYTKMSEEDEILAIQGIPFPEGNSIVLPLIIQSGIAGVFEFNVKSIENIGEIYDISLEDRLMNEFIDLKTTSQLDISLSEGMTDDRFLLHFTNTTGLEEDESRYITIYSNRDRVYIINPEYKSGSINIFNLNGQLILSEKLTGDYRQSFNLSSNDAIVLIQAQTSNQLINKKLILN